MEYKKIKTRKAYEEVADSILNMIEKQDLNPGDKIESVEQLAENFGVSLSAVREALSGLRSMGVIETRQGKGTYINAYNSSNIVFSAKTAFLMNMDDVKELYELRKFLEASTANLAANSRNEEDLKLIEIALLKMRDAKEDEQSASSADTEFHWAITQATHNNLFIKLMDSVADTMSKTIQETRKVLLHSNHQIDELYVEHRRIYEAIKDKNPIKAQKYMYEHLERVNSDLLRYIESTK